MTRGQGSVQASANPEATPSPGSPPDSAAVPNPPVRERCATTSMVKLQLNAERFEIFDAAVNSPALVSSKRNTIS